MNTIVLILLYGVFFLVPLGYLWIAIRKRKQGGVDKSAGFDPKNAVENIFEKNKLYLWIAYVIILAIAAFLIYKMVI